MVNIKVFLLDSSSTKIMSFLFSHHSCACYVYWLIGSHLKLPLATLLRREDQLREVSELHATHGAFAAILQNGQA